MPELPEVETSRRGIDPHICGRTITRSVIRQSQLRWPVSPQITALMPGQTVLATRRRGKYILIETTAGHIIIHLGMSGSVRILPTGMAAAKHDHIDIEFGHGQMLRYTDPRRFGCVLWSGAAIDEHPLLASLGPEPLADDFGTAYLFMRSRGRKMPVKSFIMDSHVVVGVGNIYANEALFMAGIRPLAEAGSVSRVRMARLVASIKQVIAHAITVGGTTLRDFAGADGLAGYFQQDLLVYGREGQPCRVCGTTLKGQRIGQRASVWCPKCQR